MNKLLFVGEVKGVKVSSFEKDGKVVNSRKLKFMIEDEEDIAVMEFKIVPEFDNPEVKKGSKVQFEVAVASFEGKLFYRAISKIQVQGK